LIGLQDDFSGGISVNRVGWQQQPKILLAHHPELFEDYLMDLNQSARFNFRADMPHGGPN